MLDKINHFVLFTPDGSDSEKWKNKNKKTLISAFFKVIV